MARNGTLKLTDLKIGVLGAPSVPLFDALKAASEEGTASNAVETVLADLAERGRTGTALRNWTMNAIAVHDCDAIRVPLATPGRSLDLTRHGVVFFVSGHQKGGLEAIVAAGRLAPYDASPDQWRDAAQAADRLIPATNGREIVSVDLTDM